MKTKNYFVSFLLSRKIGGSLTSCPWTSSRQAW
jgi:hypothetical protein